jgi:hypothetical protein
MKKETRFWQWLKPRFPPGHLIRIENPAHPGTPDVNYCAGGFEVWIELKQCDELPKRETTSVFGESGLRVDQKLWIRQRVKYGGNVWVAAKTPHKVFWIPGKHAQEFNSMTLKQLEEHHDPSWAISIGLADN